MLQYEALGAAHLPALVCIPGLLGGPDDFREFTPNWTKHFRVLLVDPNADRRTRGIVQLGGAAVREISYDSTADGIRGALARENKDAAHFVGLSIGGKMVYEFAIHFPDLFLGALVTDVGPTLFEESDLYRFVDRTVQEAPLHLPWEDLKSAFRERIPDRSLRSLMLSQIHYPHGTSPGEWKLSMRNFRAMLDRQGIGDQFARFAAVDPRLARAGGFTDVLRAADCSGIGESSLPAMRMLSSLRVHPVLGASHFLHVTHKGEINDRVMRWADVSKH